MLTLYRRHTKVCGHADRYYRRCKCPVWVEGVKDDGEYVRRSLKLASWERAEEKKRELDGGATIRLRFRQLLPRKALLFAKRPPSSTPSARLAISAKRRCASTGS
jgi:hypothetical protein